MAGRVRIVLSGIIAVLLALPLSFAAAPLACACSCAPLTPQEHVEDATLVAVGEVRSRRDNRAGDFDSTVELQIALTRVFKGPTDPLVTVYTASSSASCGISLTPGTDLVLFAYTNDSGKLMVNICTGTGSVSVDEITAITGPGTAVTPPPGGWNYQHLLASPNRFWVPVVLVGAGLITWLLVRRQRQSGRSRH